jgi:ATP-dependent exoDNAse (exonuclease V) beta subunit
MCPMQYYMEYTLGWRGQSGKKADKGTIVHKILELTALAKKALQEGKSIFEDDEIGEIETANYDPEYLDEIIDRVFDYYTSRIPHHKWLPSDRKHCRAWVWKIFNDDNGFFDPKNRVIVEAEPHFDFEIDESWAQYTHVLDDGTILEGNLALKGTIDLITDIGDNVYEVIDWKTGRRLDWATGQEKTMAKLQKDPQLRMYHLACNKKNLGNVQSFAVLVRALTKKPT